MTAPDFGGAQLAIRRARRDHAARWHTLAVMVRALEHGDPAERPALAKRAMDWEYDLTGDCAITGPLADALGVPNAG